MEVSDIGFQLQDCTIFLSQSLCHDTFFQTQFLESCLQFNTLLSVLKFYGHFDARSFASFLLLLLGERSDQSRFR